MQQTVMRDRDIDPSQRQVFLIAAMLMRIWVCRHQLRDWSEEAILSPMYQRRYTSDEYIPAEQTLSMIAYEILRANGWEQSILPKIFACGILVHPEFEGSITWKGCYQPNTTQSYFSASSKDAYAQLKTALVEASQWQARGLAFLQTVEPTVAEKLETAEGSFNHLVCLLQSQDDLTQAKNLIVRLHPLGELGIKNAEFTLIGEFRIATAA